MECPVCKDRMVLKKMDNIHVDVCDSHGIWLDKGEIEAMQESAQRRGENVGFAKRLWNVSHDY